MVPIVEIRFPYPNGVIVSLGGPVLEGWLGTFPEGSLDPNRQS
jgi:hypothetical protein